MYDTLLILIFCKNVLCHIRRTGGIVQFLLTVLLIVVMNCFLGTRFGQLYCFSKHDVSLTSTSDFLIEIQIFMFLFPKL